MKKQSFKREALFALSCICAGITNMAFAAEDAVKPDEVGVSSTQEVQKSEAPATVAADEPQVMEEVSVYGERPAAFRNITTSTEAASKALIASTNVINTEDAVKYLPSVQVRKRFIGDRNAILHAAIRTLVRERRVRRGATLIVVTGEPWGKSGTANAVEVRTV